MRAAADAASLLAHWSPLHAAANAAAIALLAGLIALRESWRALAAIVLLALFAQLAVLSITEPGEFRGASGFLFALLAYALARSGSATALSLAGVAYIGVQAMRPGESSVLPDGVAIAWPVHAAGALAGAAAAWLQRLSSQRTGFRAVEWPPLPTKGKNMGLFSSIIDKFRHLGSKDIPGVRPTDEALKQRGEMPAQGTSAAPQPTQLQNVDIEAVLKDLAAKKGGGGNYKTSIVDLLKLLDLDSSLDARKELAAELGVNAGPHGSAEQNIALHKAVMRKVAENGGKVPAFMKD